MRLLLIDGSNLIFRAYYATEKLTMTNSDGVRVNAIHTLISMLNKLVKDTKPTHVFIALDTGTSTFRHDMYPEYKGKRSETPQDLKDQFPLAKELYEAMGIKFGYTDKFEADDLIATYAKIGAKQGHHVMVFSGDKDLLQLVDDQTMVMTPKLGFAKAVNYDVATFEEKFTFLPDRFLEYKALVGDSSDNIIGVAGVGDKTAKNLINEYSNIEEIITEAKSGNQTKKIWQNIADSEEQIRTNLNLVELVTNVVPEFELDDFAFDGFELDKFVPFLKKHGFTKFYTDFAKQIGTSSEGVQSKVNIKNIDHKFSNELNLELLDVTLETYIIPIYSNDNYIANPISGILVKNGLSVFYLKDNYEQLRHLMTSDIFKVTYNLKLILGTIGIFDYKNVRSDIYLASSLIDSNNFKKSISELAFDLMLTDYPQAIKDITSEKGNVEFLLNDIASYVERMYIAIQNSLEEKEMVSLLKDIELPLTKVLAKMEVRGVYVNTKELDEVSISYQKQLDIISDKIAKYTDINVNSVQQLSSYLFETRELPTKKIKKTKSAYATDVANLEKLKANIINDEQYQSDVEFIDLILQYRKIKKIHSTYLVGLAKHITDGKVHPIINQLLTDTGRLSIIEPNIQNMPIRTKEGQIIRSLFDSGDYEYIVAIDYSQVELRVVAHLANEKHMITNFNDGLDIHAETAKKMFDKDEVTSEDRSRAKAINFGIIYGMSKYGLAKQVGIDANQADDFIEKYLKTYPQIKEYMREQILFAKKNGYVKTEFGRRRYIEDINSSKHLEQENAKRIAINTPVQGTAADIMKLAMIKVNDYLDTTDDVRLAMQIHDELVFYCNDLKLVYDLKSIFESVVDYEIKLVADIGHGKNWLDCK